VGRAAGGGLASREPGWWPFTGAAFRGEGLPVSSLVDRIRTVAEM